MTARTYRVVVRGVFDGLDDDTRTALLATAADHDIFASRFTEEGTLTYDEQLSAFSHRVVVRVDPGPDEEALAATAGELSALAALERLGVGHRRLRSSVTSTDDVTIRRR
ncbi:DUF6204 family protein [Modestobacter sp. NPDC049651]|uniref:DUF6204 family protein n=1 Tax=unclassified Modestobacter TaxID=2643866 RepID=UPI00340EE2DB